MINNGKLLCVSRTCNLATKSSLLGIIRRRACSMETVAFPFQMTRTMVKDVNRLFYENKISLRIGNDNEYIESIHKEWFGDYAKLETCHSYIQWLFPINAPSAFNRFSQPLSQTEQEWFIECITLRRSRQSTDQSSEQEEENEIIKDRTIIKQRVLTSYRLILDFFGLRLLDEYSGEIARVESNSVFNILFVKHLNSSPHNFLRISRILQFLGLVGLEHYKVQFLGYLIKEIFIHGHLVNAQHSCVQYWIPCLANMNHIMYFDQVVLLAAEQQRLRRDKQMDATTRTSSNRVIGTIRDYSALQTTLAPFIPTFNHEFNTLHYSSLSPEYCQFKATTAATDSANLESWIPENLRMLKLLTAD